MEIARVTADELSRDLANVLERVTAGEEVEVVRDGIVIALMTPPELTEAMLEGLVKAGVLDSDWKTTQAELKRWLVANPPLPAEPHRPSLSETLIAMREEETR
ncbi:hypothetical protein [Umezawaea sp. NPDC059074]|uniref:hypothetical protein n=1 Tax=Umezawaea sp. NPDC059074 TaxID=3346716 RepID=UPI00367A0716